MYRKTAESLFKLLLLLLLLSCLFFYGVFAGPATPQHNRLGFELLTGVVNPFWTVFQARTTREGRGKRQRPREDLKLLKHTHPHLLFKLRSFPTSLPLPATLSLPSPAMAFPYGGLALVSDTPKGRFRVFIVYTSYSLLYIRVCIPWVL